MSWGAVLALSASAYALKALGAFLGGRVPDTGAARDALGLAVVAVLGALVVTQTVDGGRSIVIDPRLASLAVAALLIWRRAPLLVVVLAAGATAAGLRLL